ncbi:uncharacterized protein DUF4190 [Amycolatopsis sulphurea]|uniref:Uncharacterized protein DUF4190 n=1 Tax=Amycolatopsis sulphurea TaxID=76022 RepID=A0A2A9F826_9PSEU|nr:DUF4190 domain-containing protein [Amycolatopsis sulphurea]PFG47318.1 uncharacterized protein DUF4190 [Amycolatopsis sulphurea]
MTNPPNPPGREDPPATAEPTGFEPPATAEPAPFEPPATAGPGAPSAGEPVVVPPPLPGEPTPSAKPDATPPAAEPAQPSAAVPMPPSGWTAPEPGFVTPGSTPTGYHVPGSDPSGIPVYGSVGQPPAYGQPGYSAVSPYPPATGGYPAYGQPYQPYGLPPEQNTGLAIGALVCSLVGILTCLLALPGVIMGHIALSKANRGEAGGRGMALAAIAVGYAFIALYVSFGITVGIMGATGYFDTSYFDR